MTVTLNGKSHESTAEGGSITVAAFLEGLDLGDFPVLVEVNGEAILVREFEERAIRDGDTIEVIRMVAGG